MATDGHAEEEDEEDDYMSMIIPDTTTAHSTTNETSIQRRARKQKENELKAHQPSKRDLAALESTSRTTALSTSTLDPSNKGFKLLSKLGYKPGDALGATSRPAGSPAARTEPIHVSVKEDRRGGVGLDSERKRKIREDAAAAAAANLDADAEGEDGQGAKRARKKPDEGEYRARVGQEREERRREAQILGAMKVLEKLEGDRLACSNPNPNPDNSARPRSVNVLYRGLVRRRLQEDAAARARRLHPLELLDSSSSSLSSRLPRRNNNEKLPRFEDAEEELEDRHALGKDVGSVEAVALDRGTLLRSRHHSSDDDDGDEEEEERDNGDGGRSMRRKKTKTVTLEADDDEDEDEELATFEALDSEERLGRLVSHLREEFCYCFWCKYGYGDRASLDEGCPGLTEDEHG